MSGDWKASLEDLDALVRIQPNNPEGYAARACLQATCADAKYRDGKRAVEDAQRACELTKWKCALHLDYLASAYAESGDFAAAIEWQKEALEDPNYAVIAGSDAKYRLRVYEQKKPVHFGAIIPSLKKP